MVVQDRSDRSVFPLLGGHGDDRGVGIRGISGVALHGSELPVVLDDDRGDDRLVRRLDDLGVEGDQRITGADTLLLLDVRGEALALELDGVESDVDEQFDAVVQANPDSVREQRQDLTVARGRHGGRARHDGDALTDVAAGEHRVRNLAQRDNPAGERSGDGGDCAGTEGGLLRGGRSRSIGDRDGWGDPNSDVTLIGDIAKKDGTRVRSSAHLDIANADIPADVWNALRAMRPDLTR